MAKAVLYSGPMSLVSENVTQFTPPYGADLLPVSPGSLPARHRRGAGQTMKLTQSEIVRFCDRELFDRIRTAEWQKKRRLRLRAEMTAVPRRKHGCQRFDEFHKLLRSG